MSQDQLEESVAAVRWFNRFYTRHIGVLQPGLLKTRFSLTQARILYELAQHEQTTPSDLIHELGIDPGYLSRLLSRFEADGLVRKTPSKTDGRRRLLTLTPEGQETFTMLDGRSREETASLLHALSGEQQQRLLQAMRTIEAVLDTTSAPAAPYLLRPHRSGDIGWITCRHGVLYAEEYGFDETFEALVAEILAHFIRNHNPKRERIWMAERDGEPIGSVMIVDAGDQVAQLRLLLVEPRARGSGIGRRLVEACIDFSRQRGYRKIKLWTQRSLIEARRLYAKLGFDLVEEEPHTSFGHDLIGEVWALSLRNVA